MRSSSAVKLILIIFFIVFFGGLFYYFYDPNFGEEEKKEFKDKDGIFSVLPFGNSEIITSIFGEDKEKNTDKEKGDKNIKPGVDNVTPKKEEYSIPILRQISNIPTAGAYIQKLTKTQLFDINQKREGYEDLVSGENFAYHEIRFISTKNNHVFRTYDFSLDSERISNVTIPKIFDVQFFDIDNYLIRYVNDYGAEKTYFVTLSDRNEKQYDDDGNEVKTKKTKKFQGIFLEDNLKEVDILEKERKIIYTKKTEIGHTGYISNPNGGEKKRVFFTPLKEINIKAYDSKKIFLTNKSSRVNNTLSFLVDSNKALKIINYPYMGGYALPSPDFSKTLYSGVDRFNNKFSLFVVTNKERRTLILNKKTLAEKCIWSVDNIHVYCAIPGYVTENDPDDWYKGKKYFSDEIHKINTNTGDVEPIFIPTDVKYLFDIVKFQLTPNERYLYFKDKKTDFYWSLDLKRIAEKKASPR